MSKHAKEREEIYRVMWPFRTAERPNLKRTCEWLGIDDVLRKEIGKIQLDTKIDKMLQTRETPTQTFRRHQHKQAVEAGYREREAEKQRIQDSMGILGGFSEGEGMETMIALRLQAKRGREQFQRQAAETRRKQDAEYYKQTARAAWLRDERLIEESRVRREHELAKARIRRRGYP